MKEGGIGAIHLTYSHLSYKGAYDSFPSLPLPEIPGVNIPPIASPNGDPEMQMNTYNMNAILFALQIAGIKATYLEFTDEDGPLGVYLYFQKPYRNKNGYSSD